MCRKACSSTWSNGGSRCQLPTTCTTTWWPSRPRSTSGGWGRCRPVMRHCNVIWQHCFGGLALVCVWGILQLRKAHDSLKERERCICLNESVWAGELGACKFLVALLHFKKIKNYWLLLALVVTTCVLLLWVYVAEFWWLICCAERSAFCFVKIFVSFGTVKE